MKKPVKTALIIAGSVIGAVVLILIIAAVLHICPPKGPWPMPPWCEGLEIREGSDAQVTFQVNVPHSIDISAGEVYLSIDGRDRILMDRLRDMTYTATTTAAGQEELIYRYESSAGVSEDKRWRVVHSKQTVHDGVSSWGGQSLDPGFFAVLGIDPADTWGRNYNFMMVENTRDNIDTAYDRIARLGAKETSARDFFWATYDGKGKPNVDLDDLGYVIEGEIFLNDHRDEEQTQEDLDRLAKAAHDRGMEIAWRANLAFNDIGAYIFKDISSEIVTDHEKIVSQKTEAWIDHFFDEWERVLLYKAEMLNNAGYDIMIVTPSWHTPTYQGYEEKANQRWKQLIS
ncbi:hypothetical protein KY362_08400, partial [Candidatus Woesearchaeota archaeon]|nr:hypothetical protein [Candidatus Woesearchaeota archaeon]